MRNLLVVKLQGPAFHDNCIGLGPILVESRQPPFGWWTPLILPGETIQETLTLASYRLFILNWANNPSDHGVRRAYLATSNIPIQKIDVPRSGTLRCMGLLAVPRTRGCLVRAGHEHGWLVHRDTAAKGRGRPDQVAFSGARRADQGRRRRAACKIRRWIRLEIHGAE